jgi:transcriptional regulator with XRE-family HTH domain
MVSWRSQPRTRFAQFLRVARRRRRVSGNYVCEATGRHRPDLAAWESGRKLPSLLSFAAVAVALDLDGDELRRAVAILAAGERPQPAMRAPRQDRLPLEGESVA